MASKNKILPKYNIILKGSIALDKLILKFRPSRNTNSCFHEIFYERESAALAGRRYKKFIRLLLVYLLTLFAIAYSMRSQSNLQEKMEDPFVLGVTADIPALADFVKLKDYLDVQNNAAAVMLADKYKYSNIYQYYKFPNFFSNSKDKNRYFGGRSIVFDDPMIAKILAGDNLIVGHGFDTIAQLSIYPENNYSIIITEDMYHELYPPDYKFKFPFLDLTHFDSTSLKRVIYDGDSLYLKDNFEQEYFSGNHVFPFLITPKDRIMIPISAIVKKLPDGCDFLTTQGYRQCFINNEARLTNKSNEVNKLSFLIQLDDDLNPIKYLSPVQHDGQVNNVYSEKFLSELEHSISDYLIEAETDNGIQSYIKSMFMYQGSRKLQMFISEYMMAFKPLIYVSVRLSEPVSFDDMQKFVQQWEKSDSFKDSDLYDNVVDIIPFYDPDINISESSYPPKYNAVGINFNEIDNIDEFADDFKNDTRIELEMSRVKSLKNYLAVTKLVILLVIGLTIISIVFIISLLTSTIRGHLLKSRKNLGTFMAMGINMKSLYMRVMLVYILLAGLLGYLGVAVIHILVYVISLLFQTEAIKIVFIHHWVVLFIFVVSLISGFAAAFFLIRRFFNKPPGDLIYGDDDSVLIREKKLSSKSLRYTRKRKDS